MNAQVRLSRRAILVAAAAVGSWNGPALAQSSGALDLALKPHMMGAQLDYIDIVEKVSNVDVRAGAPLLRMPMIAAGVASARYDASLLSVTDAKGRVELIQRDDPADPSNDRYLRHWTAGRAVKGDVTIAYHATPNPPATYRGGPVMDMRAEDGGMNGRAGYFLVYPDDAGKHRIHVRWDLSGMPAGSRGVWTHGEGDATEALTSTDLESTIFMAGPVKSYPANTNGRFAIFWHTEPNWSVEEVGPTLEKIYKYYGELFDDTTHVMRIFMRRGRNNGGSGAGGSFLMNTPSADLGLPPTNVPALLAFLGHEILHQFPEELSDVGQGEPTYWWSEGVATFYQNVLLYRLGLKTPEQFVSDWNRFLGNYYSDPNRLLSYKDITGGMFGAVGLNLMYGKGHAFMMLLDYRIKQKTGGKRSLDDLVFPLVRQHRRGGSYTRADVLAAIDRELGAEGRALFEEFRAGGKLLDLPSDIMGPCFHRETVVYRPFALGFDQAAATTANPRTIKNLIRGSTAERAGVREGDEVVSTFQPNALRADTAATLTLELRRNGAPVTATFVPRIDPFEGYRWVRDAAVPASACKF